MIQGIPQEVLNVFTAAEQRHREPDAGNITVETLNGGLINHSFKISPRSNNPFLLQQINKHVFAHPQDVQENYILIWEYAEFECTGLRLPAPVYCGQQSTLYVDNRENFWRAFEFIEDSRMIKVAEQPEQANATAKAFATFTAAFDEFNVSLLKEVIPDFHNLAYRFQQFEESLGGEQYERMAEALPLINELKQRERYIHFFEIMKESGEFPLRVMHHDAKISNVLFSTKTGKVICPVDFDTVMPGYFISDLGDMIRSMVCPEEEESTRFEQIGIRKDFYEAILSGYLSIMDRQLTGPEKKYIHYAGLLMIYMQALRFLADFLNGDTYYKVSQPRQNLDRAANQVILLQKLEEFLVKEYNFQV